MTKDNKTNIDWRNIKNYLWGILYIVCALIYWFLLSKYGNYDFFSILIKKFDLFNITWLSYGIIYPICLSLLTLLIFVIRSFIANKQKTLIKYVPKAIGFRNKKLILNQVKISENTYSLQTCFSVINIDFAFKTDDIVLSLNGLVGDKNREEISTSVTNIQITKYLETIRRWQNAYGGINTETIHLLDENELNEYFNVFQENKIRDSINSVCKDIEGKDNTFHFIGDKFGVFSAKTGKKGSLELKIYKTNYFTFCVMNALYSRTPILQTIAKRMCENREHQMEGYLLLFPFFASLGANIIIEVLSASKGEGFLVQKRSPKSFGKASQYHISVNEAFSFTDFDDGKPDFSKCIQRGIEEELGLNVERIDNFKKTALQRIKYLDLFLNPNRGSLGISLAYKTDVNPSLITYYPGVDKVIESSKHVCVFGIRNYVQMNNFLSLYNWIPYTPYILKRYIIIKENSIKNLRTLWLLGANSRSAFSRILLYDISIICFIILSLYFGLYVKNSLASLLCTPIVSRILSAIGYFIMNLYKKHKTRKKNIDLISPGSFPYKNVLLYTGDKMLEDKDIVLTLKTQIQLSPDDISYAVSNQFNYDVDDIYKVIDAKIKGTIELNKTEDVTWDNINIISYKTGIRRVSDNNEIPSLYLSGFLSNQKNNKSLFVRAILS